MKIVTLGNGIRVRQRGQGMTEYIIITALVAIAAIAAFTFFGGGVRAQVAGMAQELGGTTATAQITNAKTAGQHAATEGNTQKTLNSYNNSTATN